jgi:hypothetical protein
VIHLIQYGLRGLFSKREEKCDERKRRAGECNSPIK